MPFPTQVAEKDPELSDQQKRQANETRAFLWRLRAENRLAEQEFHQECRGIHKWLKGLFQNKPWAMAILEQVEHDCPWLHEASTTDRVNT